MMDSLTPIMILGKYHSLQ